MNSILRPPPGKDRPARTRSIQWDEELEKATFFSKQEMPRAISKRIEVQIPELICAVGKNKAGTYSLEQLLGIKTQHCYNVSHRFATNLLRVSSTRIFSDRYQAILELPVNSIDSYRQGKSSEQTESVVGKFGLGFLSILSWVVESSRKLHLDSRARTATGEIESFTATIASQQNELTVDYTPVTPTSQKTGTLIQLDFASDPVSFYVVPSFKKQLEKLFDIQDVRIKIKEYINEILEAESEVTSVPESILAEVTISFFVQDSKLVRINVADTALGITSETFFNSLLVPSSSTKGISASSIPSTWEDLSGFESLPIDSPHTGLYLTLNDVAVAFFEASSRNVNASTAGRYILSFPGTLGVPVSRDDVSIQTRAEEKLFEQALVNLADSVVLTCKDLTLLFELLDQYSLHTRQHRVQFLIHKIKSAVYKWDEFYVPSGYSIYSKLELPEPIKIPQPDLVQLSQRLAEVYLADETWFLGKKVIQVPDLEMSQITNGGLLEYLFIPASVSKADLLKVITGYSKERLLPATKRIPDRLKNKFEKYTNLLKKFVWYDLDQAKTRLYPIWSLLVKLYKLYPKDNRVRDFTESLALANQTAPDDQNFHWNEQLLQAVYSKLLTVPPPDVYQFNSSLEPNSTNLMYKNKFKDLNSPPKSLGKHTRNLIQKFYLWQIASMPVLKLMVLDTVYFYQFSLDFDKLLAVLKKYIQHPLMQILYLREITTYAYARDLTDLQKILPIVPTLVNELSTQFTFEKIQQSYFGGLLENNFSKFTQILLNFLLTREIENEPYLALVEQANQAEYSFKASQLVQFIFSRDLDLNSPRSWLGEVKNFPRSSPLQVLEIAVNEGTSKPFLSAMFTELIQNSVDAIRSQSGTGVIEVSTDVSDRTLSVYDSAGFDDSAIVPLLTPFLSGKTSDLLSTGEMGTGFFNLYRKTRKVKIETSNSQRSLVIEAVPLTKQARVVDLDYFVRFGNKAAETGTQVTVWLSRSVKKTEFMLTSALQYQIIRHIEYPIYFNSQKPINQTLVKVFENEVGAGYTNPEYQFPSYIYTNGVPFAPFSEYAVRIRPVLRDLAGYSFIFDLNKRTYLPSQSRTSIQLVSLAEFVKFIGNSIYLALVRAFDDDTVDHNPLMQAYLHRINFYRNGPFDQVLPADKDSSNSLLYRNFLQNQIPGTSTTLARLIRASGKQMLRHLAETGSLQRVDQEEIIDRNTLGQSKAIRSVIKEWYRQTSLPMSRGRQLAPTTSTVKTIAGPDPSLTPSQRRVYLFLSDFIREFWTFSQQLEQHGKLQGTQFNRHSNPPQLVCTTQISKGVAGFYTPIKHTITLPLNILQRYSQDIKTVEESKHPEMEFLNLSLGQLIHPHSPSTLIHELAHAWEGSTHLTGGHGDIRLIIDQQLEVHSFDSGASRLFSWCCGLGLLNYLHQRKES